MVHFIIWKFILMDLTKKGIKGTPFSPEREYSKQQQTEL